MESKDGFAIFIANKRKEANFTQKELADLIHVSESAVSKWERGISYPDISLISSICKVLSITEHEFITASDDIKTKEEQIRLNKINNFERKVHTTLIPTYLIVVIICFFYNIIIDKKISWSIIVLIAFCLAFCIFNLYYFLKENRMLISLSSVSILLYILLPAIKATINVEWSFIQGAIITTIWLLPVWTIYIISNITRNAFIRSGLALIIIGLFTLLMNPVSEAIVGRKPFDLKNIPQGNTAVAIPVMIGATLLMLVKPTKNPAGK